MTIDAPLPPDGLPQPGTPSMNLLVTTWGPDGPRVYSHNMWGFRRRTRRSLARGARLDSGTNGGATRTGRDGDG